MSGIKFINQVLTKSMDNINSCTIGKIESFDPEKMKAEITPLINKLNKNGEIEEMPMLIEVPVSLVKAGPFFIRPPYKKGDLVVIIFADSDIDNTMITGDKSVANSKRVHSLDDAIVISGINPFNENLTNEYKEDLLISHEDLKALIAIDDEGNIEIKAKNMSLKIKESLTLEIIKDLNITVGNRLNVNSKKINLTGQDGVNISGKNNSESW